MINIYKIKKHFKSKTTNNGNYCLAKIIPE